MQRLWEKKNRPGVPSQHPVTEDPMFNGVELELTWEDLDRLEQDILSGRMAELGTRGFFFGEFADEHYREHDLAFIRQARAELFMGLRVFYNSSW